MRVKEQQHAGVPLRRVRCWETFLYTLKAGPAGGRLRRPSSAGSHATLTEALPSPSHQGRPEQSRPRSKGHAWGMLHRTTPVLVVMRGPFDPAPFGRH
jgi:hypothetical protein